MEYRLLKLCEVCELVRLPRSVIYRMMAARNFPRPLKLGDGGKSAAVRWRSDELEAWIETRPRAGGTDSQAA